MTVEAPRHTERLSLVNHIHLINLPVAIVAADTPVHMHRVVEISVVWHLVDTDPLHRSARLPTSLDCRQLWTERFDLRVTGHAGLGRWHIGMTRHLDITVAVAAIHPELISMNGVGKRYRLLRHVAHVGVLWGEIIPDTPDHHRSEGYCNDQHF